MLERVGRKMSGYGFEAPVLVTVGFAVRGRGGGVAYALIAGKPAEETIVRVAFSCRPLSALLGRDAGYAALTAVAGAALERGIARVAFRCEDRALALDVAERRALPTALALPYVTLRCTLNRFASASVAFASDRLTRDLTARARAEASLDVAA